MNKWTLWASLFAASIAFAQAPAGKLAFEVASIKPSDIASQNMIRMGASVDAGLARYTNFSLKDYIRTAYRVKNFQVDGPAWIENARFNIEAKLPAGATQDQVPEMLQSLLEERFKLTLHRETKDHAIYGLVVGKGGPKLKPVDTGAGAGAPPADAGRGGRGPMRPGAMQVTVDEAGAHLKASTNLGNLAEMISRFSERPVLDQTGITGDYEFDLVFSPEVIRGGGRGPGGGGGDGGPGGPAAGASDTAGSIYDSVQRFGLKLEPKKAPLEILIVDNIEKAPTEN